MVNISNLAMLKLEQKEEEMTYEQVIARLNAVKAELEAKTKKVEVTMKKNQKPGNAAIGRKYVLLSKKLNMAGKVPQQQADIADLLSKHMEVGVEYTEAEVFSLLIDQSSEYYSLTKSVQDPTYLFRYYRGLNPKDGKHAGFIARNFIRQIN